MVCIFRYANLRLTHCLIVYLCVLFLSWSHCCTLHGAVDSSKSGFDRVVTKLWLYQISMYYFMGPYKCFGCLCRIKFWKCYWGRRPFWSSFDRKHLCRVLHVASPKFLLVGIPTWKSTPTFSQANTYTKCSCTSLVKTLESFLPFLSFDVLVFWLSFLALNLK